MTPPLRAGAPSNPLESCSGRDAKAWNRDSASTQTGNTAVPGRKSKDLTRNPELSASRLWLPDDQSQLELTRQTAFWVKKQNKTIFTCYRYELSE